jgi:hypothetical protein
MRKREKGSLNQLLKGSNKRGRERKRKLRMDRWTIEEKN